MSIGSQQDYLSDLELLRTEIQECLPSQFKQRKDQMLTLIERIISKRMLQDRSADNTVQMLSKAFLGEISWQPTIHENEVKPVAFGPHSYLLSNVTGLDAVHVYLLFCILESQAEEWVSSLSALAQTTKPRKVKEYHERLPSELILHAASALKSAQLKAAKTKTHKAKKIIHDAWVNAGFPKRRAERRELHDFCKAQGELHSVGANTIQNNWIPKWRKQLTPS